MAESTPSFGMADLSNCDREPIHIPGSIQPHGVLLILHPADRRILQVAGPTESLLGQRRDALIGAPLDMLAEAGTVNALIELVAGLAQPSRPDNLFGFTTVDGRRFDAAIHGSDAGVIVELEPATPDRVPPGGMLSLVHAMLANVQETRTVLDFCQRAAEQVREATGFDRVMVYRFRDDGTGHVIAEARRQEIGSYLDLHYPASDIPAQARELYRRNWLRLIPDAIYAPEPLHPAVSPLTGRPVDMALCALRNVSPLHLEYLANMGVRASMSMSLMHGTRLWGLISCHHYTPKHLSQSLRNVCELFAQMFSLQLEARQRAEVLEQGLRMRDLHGRILSALADTPDLADGLMHHRPSLLDLIPSSGVALWLDGRFTAVGSTPDEEAVGTLARWLSGRVTDLWHTDRLPELWPEAEKLAAVASGLLVVSVSRVPRDFIIWFRPEVIHTVTWAGNPNKPVEVVDGVARLTPRRSFAAWQESVRFHSVPWSEAEIDAARALRTTLLEVVLRRVDQVAREREAAHRQQELLLAELDHRVKNTLANIQVLAQHSARNAGSLDSFTASFGERLRAMAQAHSLLTQSRWRGIEFRKLLEEEIRAHHDPVAPQFRLEGPRFVLRPKAALALSMAVHELVTNAAKYGALSLPGGRIDVRWALVGDGADGRVRLEWTESGGPPVLPPTRFGFGRVVIERSLAYEVDGDTTLTFDPGGVRFEALLPANHVVDGTAEPLDAGRAAADETAPPASGPRRILLVEDSAFVAEAVAAFLAGQGVTVLGPANRVPMAMVLIEGDPPDAAVLDVDLDGTPSWPVADSLADRGIPFLLATAYSADGAVPERFRNRPRLLKPYSVKDLGTALDALLAGAPGG